MRSDRVIKHPVWLKSVETRIRIGPLRSDEVIKNPIWGIRPLRFVSVNVLPCWFTKADQ